MVYRKTGIKINKKRMKVPTCLNTNWNVVWGVSRWSWWTLTFSRLYHRGVSQPSQGTDEIWRHQYLAMATKYVLLNFHQLSTSISLSFTSISLFLLSALNFHQPVLHLHQPFTSISLSFTSSAFQFHQPFTSISLSWDSRRLMLPSKTCCRLWRRE